MKLLKVEINNLASFKGVQQTIDFTQGPLAHEALFSIVGPTGAGKSTILDAISLALYGNTARFEKTFLRPNGYYQDGEKHDRNVELYKLDVRNILHRGEKQCHAIVYFEASDGNQYKAVWTTGKKTKIYSKAQNHFYLIDNGREIEIESIDNVLGMGYDDFCRAVMLSQGSFAEFLKMDTSAKAMLLERVSGTQIYTHVAQKIQEHANEANEALKEILNSISGYKAMLLSDRIGENGEPSPLQQAIDLEAQLSKQINESVSRQNSLEKQLVWLDRLAALKQKKKEEQEKLDAERNKLNDIADKENDLSMHDKLAPINDDFIKYDNCIDKINKSSKELPTTQVTYTLANEDWQASVKLLEKSKVDFEKAKADSEELEKLITEARKIETNINNAAQSQTKAKDDYDKATKALEEVKVDIDSNTKGLNELKEKIEANNKILKPLQQYATAIERYQELVSLVKRYDTEKREQELIRERLGFLRLQEAQMQELLSGNETYEQLTAKGEQLQYDLNLCRQSINELEKYNKDNEEYTAKCKLIARANDDIARQEQLLAEKSVLIKSAEDKFKGANEVLNQLLAEDITSRRTHLVEGEPCPLCGSTSHPYATQEVVNEFVAKTREIVDAHLESVKKLEEEIKHIDKEMANGKAVVQQLTPDVNRLGERCGTFEKAHKEDIETGIEVLKSRISYINDEISFNSSKIIAVQYNEVTRRMGVTQTSLNELLSSDEWKQQLQEMGLQSYVRQWEERSVSYNSVTADNDRCHAELLRVETLIQSLADQKVQKEKEVNRKKEELDVADKKYDELCKSLNAVFDGRRTDDVDAERKMRIKEVEEKYNQALDREAEKRESKTKAKSTLDNIQYNIKQAVGERDRLLETMSLWLRDNTDGMTIDDVRRYLDSTTPWHQWREKIQAIKDRIRSLHGAIETHNQNIEQHFESEDKTELCKEMLEERLQSERDSIAPAKSEYDAVNSKLLSHRSAEMFIADKREVLEAAQNQAAQWKTLTDLFGNKEHSDKLREVVQAHTLAMLVEQANVHLNAFAPRYALQMIPHTIDICVRDDDMLGLTRNVTSVSGGETFLISLALALALSTLSSRNNGFDILFIDEGFGSLDAQYRELVIMALYNINATQGKKICLISHTDEVIKGINTSIVVEKHNNGVSTLKLPQ